MEAILKQISDFADRAHGEQMRRYTPERYIVHPLRVMEMCRKYTNEISILGAAILHDVLEDTSVTRVELKVFLLTVMNEENAERTTKLVEELTDVFTKKLYPNHNRRRRKSNEADRIAKTSPDSQTIKYADIIDNAPEITAYDPAFAKRFLNEYRYLLNRIPKGNLMLYRKALETVNTCIRNLKEQENK